jgi:hypothetical protein
MEEQAVGVGAEDARENMWMYGGTSGGRMVNIARVSALLPIKYRHGSFLTTTTTTQSHNGDYWFQHHADYANLRP